MKKKIDQNINRIDLLTDSKIGEIKELLKGLSREVLKLSKRVTDAEVTMLRKENEQLPTDVLALTKTEFELRLQLAQMIQEATETRDWL